MREVSCADKLFFCVLEVNDQYAGNGGEWRGEDVDKVDGLDGEEVKGWGWGIK